MITSGVSTSSSHGGPSDATRPVVLLVDDDSKNLLALESILEDGSFRLQKAQTGNQALLALMADDFAAIVLDVQMPDMSGIELARLIKQRRRTQHVPIIFLTAHYREDEHAILGYDVGAVDYLTKPVNPMVLRSKVNVFVDLFRKTQALARMNLAALAAEEALRVANAELEARNAALEREAEERRRRIRAESAQAEAEAANAAKDRFLAILSHELRTPLSPIIHAVTLLAEHDCPPHLRDAIETIHRNVRLEARLIDDLLDLARVRNDKLHLSFQTVEMHDVLRQAIDICRPDIAARKIILVEELDASATYVLADPARLQQVFWNLLSNAAKFTPSGGTITVGTSGPDITRHIAVEISDNGTGIAPEKIRRIFNAFEQADAPAPTGLGLGLAICKALVERHRGTIEARSDGVGKGATFRIRLPGVQPVVKAQPSAPVVMPDQAGLRLLVVDDHRDTLETLQILLKRRGYAVRTAGSIAQALQVADDYEFDLLVSDIGLPDGRGTELLLRLEKQTRHPFLAIAMSGFGTEEDLRSSHHAGFAQHLTKPVEFDTLHEAIARLSSNLPKAIDEPSG
jgi:signal transduction histidine kinase